MEEPTIPYDFLLLFILVFFHLKSPLPHPFLLINFGFITSTELELTMYSGNKQTRGKEKKNPHFLKYKGESQETGEYFSAIYL